MEKPIILSVPDCASDRARLELVREMLIAMNVRGVAIVTRRDTPHWVHLEVSAAHEQRAQQLSDAFEAGRLMEAKRASRANGNPDDPAVKLVLVPGMDGRTRRVIAT